MTQGMPRGFTKWTRAELADWLADARHRQAIRIQTRDAQERAAAEYPHSLHRTAHLMRAAEAQASIDMLGKQIAQISRILNRPTKEAA